MLSYTALSANKLLPAIAEADLLERDCGSQGALIATALRSVAFERKHWPQLAQRSSDSLWKHDANPDDTLTTLLMLHVVMAYAAIATSVWSCRVLGGKCPVRHGSVLRWRSRCRTCLSVERRVRVWPGSKA